MNWEMPFVFAVVAVAGALFASGRVRFDAVAAGVLLSLMLSGILSSEEAFAGFGSPVVVLVAALMILGEILTRTGIAYSVGHTLVKLGGDSEARLLVMLMVSAALIGCVMSSTAVVAILIPVVVGVARRSSTHVSRLLLPLSYAALISGMLTLIAATPNIIVSAELIAMGYERFGFFSNTPVGLTVLVCAVIYMIVLGRRLLPRPIETEPKADLRTGRDILADFDVLGSAHQFKVPAGSLLVGRRISDSLISHINAKVLILQRKHAIGESIIANPDSDRMIKPDDIILVAANPLEAEELAQTAQLRRRKTTPAHLAEWAKEVGIAVVTIHSESNLVGRTLSSAHFSGRYKAHAIAIRRRGQLLVKGRMMADHGSLSLESGDVLLLAGAWQDVDRLESFTKDFVLLLKPAEHQDYVPQRRKAPVALAIVIGMVLLSSLNILPVVQAVLLAIGAGMMSGCISIEDAYRSIPVSSIVLIACMLPVADALDKTGGVDLIVNALASGFGSQEPLLIMTALFFLSVALGLFLTNVATTVLMAPIAINTAEMLEVAPHAFALTVMVAASASFITPFSTPVVSLVVKPGSYRLTNFLKVGMPLLVLTWIVCVGLIPLLFPF